MAKKRPSLKNYLSTGDVFAGEEHKSLPENPEKSAAPDAGEDAGRKKEAEADPGKKMEGAGKSSAGGKKKTAEPVKKTAARKKPAPGASRPKKKSPGAGGTSGTDASEGTVPGEAGAILEMLAPEDRPMWEKLFAAAETVFLPLDLVERREDFRTMPRDRFTLFRLEEPGKPLLHVRTSVQIREPLVCLIKWDETGMIAVFRSPSMS